MLMRAEQWGACALFISPLAKCSCWATVVSSRRDPLRNNEQAQQWNGRHQYPKVEGVWLRIESGLFEFADGDTNVAFDGLRCGRPKDQDDDAKRDEPMPDA
jgi:hypothetical protein